MHRRQFLTTAAATMPLIAGCTGGDGDGGEQGATPTETETPTATPTPTGEPQTLAQQKFPDYKWGLLDQTDPKATTTIEMTKDLRFRPTIAKFPKGSTVTWKNPSFKHTLVIPKLNVDREVPGGEKISVTVDQTGTIDYVCDIHPPKMLGRLLVTEEKQTPTTTQTKADTTVVMKDTTFQTLKATVDTGGTVKWVNKDGFAHTVTSAQFHEKAKSWSFDKQVSGGGSVTHTFDEKGVYEYYCTIHGKSTMCGAVLVGGATLDKSLPCGSDSNGGGGYY